MVAKPCWHPDPDIFCHGGLAEVRGVTIEFRDSARAVRSAFKAGSSLRWAVVDGPTIDDAIEVLHTRASYICAEFFEMADEDECIEAYAEAFRDDIPPLLEKMRDCFAVIMAAEEEEEETAADVAAARSKAMLAACTELVEYLYMMEIE